MANYNYNSVSNQTVAGTTTDDTFTFSGGGSAIYLDAGGGNDAVTATELSVLGYQSSTIFGGAGDDSISGFSSKSLIFGGLGADSVTVNANGDDVTVFGGQGNDTIRGLSGEEARIFGNQGDDVLLLRVGGATGGSLSNGTVFGGQGNDTIAGSEEGQDYLSGDIGNDFINTDDDGRNSTIIGGQGDDSVNSDGRNDLIFGNQGADSFRLRASGATVYGGQDGDSITASFAVSRQGAVNGVTPSGTSSISRTANASLLFGNLGSDTISVNVSDVTVFGGQGNDFITAAAVTLTANNAASGIAAAVGGSLLNGDLGNDSITASASTDTLIGGAGTDIFNVTGFTGSATNSLVIGDFRSGQDQLRTGFAAAEDGQNYREAATTGSGYNSALSVARNGGVIANRNYVFVAASDAGYLFYQNGGATQSLVLTGATSLSSFAADDILATVTT